MGDPPLEKLNRKLDWCHVPCTWTPRLILTQSNMQTHTAPPVKDSNPLPLILIPPHAPAHIHTSNLRYIIMYWEYLILGGTGEGLVLGDRKR